MKPSFILLLLLLLTSCPDDDELQLIKVNNYSDHLKLNGYYYRIDSSADGSEKRYYIIFLYRDGTVLWGNSVDHNYLKRHERDFESGQWYEWAKDDKYSWGLYSINYPWIYYEMYTPLSLKWYTCIQNGMILDDSTFTSTRRNCYNQHRYYSVNEKYHFKEFYPKPDSINRFIN